MGAPAHLVGCVDRGLRGALGADKTPLKANAGPRTLVAWCRATIFRALRMTVRVIHKCLTFFGTLPEAARCGVERHGIRHAGT